ncbi:MAG: hypothetical protein IJC43_04420, partial [Clostridia bacterium]|nr:hypothetical protein [Clostridia bacterium]
TLLTAQTLYKGDAAAPVAVPETFEDEKYIYTFLDWYTAPEGGTRADLSRLDESASLYARYKKTEKPHVHRYTDRITPATCEETGQRQSVCGCGDVGESEILPRVPHKFTTSADGRTETCHPCGLLRSRLSFVVDEIPADNVAELTASAANPVGTAAVTIAPMVLQELSDRGEGLTVKTDYAAIFFPAAAVAELAGTAKNRPVTATLTLHEPLYPDTSPAWMAAACEAQTAGGAAITFSLSAEGGPIDLPGGLVLTANPAATAAAPFACLLTDSGYTVVTATQSGDAVTLTPPAAGLYLLSPTRPASLLPTLLLRPLAATADVNSRTTCELLLTGAAGLTMTGFEVGLQPGEALSAPRSSDLSVVTESDQSSTLTAWFLPTEATADHRLALLTFETGAQAGLARPVLTAPATLTTPDGALAVEVAAEPVTLLDLRLHFTAGPKTEPISETAYLSSTAPGLYADPARTQPLPEPAASPLPGYAHSGWTIPQGETLAYTALAGRQFTETTTVTAAATPIEYPITYHTGAG